VLTGEIILDHVVQKGNASGSRYQRAGEETAEREDSVRPIENRIGNSAIANCNYELCLINPKATLESHCLLRVTTLSPLDAYRDLLHISWAALQSFRRFFSAYWDGQHHITPHRVSKAYTRGPVKSGDRGGHAQTVHCPLLQDSL
jgi:hypothetical protein